jgi:hypothetical protein
MIKQATNAGTTSTTLAPQSPGSKPASKVEATQLRVLTEKLAYELWEKRGRNNGNDVQDWLEAEKIARQRLSS